MQWRSNSLAGMVAACVAALFVSQPARATERFWSGGSPAGTGGFDNINDSRNWFNNVTPNSGDDLTFNNTTGFHHFANSNYGTGSFFGNIISYSGAGGIRWTGDKTFLYTFENFNDSNLLEATATLSNRTGSPDSDLQINPKGSGGVKVANVDIQNGKQLQVNGTNLLTVAGVISQSGTGNATFALNGAATVQLQNANTYGGGTTINAGTLLANNASGSGTGTGAVVVNNSGTLGGSGAINTTATGGVTINGGGTLAPGAAANTVGTLTLSANTFFTGSSGSLATFLVDLSGATADRVTVTGNLNLSTAFDQISFNSLVTPTAASYTLISYTGTLTGTFDGVVNLPANYALQYNPGELDLVAVPEPGTVAAGLLALGSLGLSQRRRVRRFLSAKRLMAKAA